MKLLSFAHAISKQTKYNFIMTQDVEKTSILALNKISFIGLGKLGLPLACCLANSGYKVIGLDKDLNKLNSLASKKVPFFEPGLDSAFEESFENFLNFSSNLHLSIQETDITVILLNTQVKNLGYSASTVLEVIETMAEDLRDNEKDYHLFILSSTVPPGTCQEIIEIIANKTKRKLGEGFGFSYVPDFVKLGTVIKDFKNPEFFLVGANNQKDFELTYELWNKVHQNNSPSFHLTVEETEIAKIALNAYIINKITFANHLSLLCENLENVNVHSITKVIGLDKRISPFFFSAGAPYGGTCFPRDVDVYIKFSQKQNTPASHLLFAEQINKSILTKISNDSLKGNVIAILGISFKPNSPVSVESPSLALIKVLQNKGKKIMGFDFLPSSYDFDTGDMEIFQDPQEAVDRADTVVFMHPDERFKDLKILGKRIVDPWGLISGSEN
jgi:UDPglucose 6-dehydrogenase